MDPKSDAKLNIEIEMAKDKQLLEVLDRNAQVVVKYNGDIAAVARQEGGVAQIISEKYAAIRIPLEQAERLLAYPEVEYMEAPRNFVYNLEFSMKAACIRAVQDSGTYDLSGEGVLLGIVDSGINYAHPDFRNEDGTTRIVSLWDQSIPGNPPLGYIQGTAYSREQINEALEQPTQAARLAKVPSQDTIGHGTHVAGIAGGNGRGSKGRNAGAAPESEFIIVKLDSPPDTALVRTVDIMLGVRYVIEKAIELSRPISVNVSIGMNEGSHDGRSLIEQFLEDMAQVWKTNICAGSGNEGQARNHLEGKVNQGGVETFEVNIGPNKQSYNLSVWQSFIDRLAFQIKGPNGGATPIIYYNQPPAKYVVGDAIIYVSFAGPSPLNGDVEFGIYMYGQNGKPINAGAWEINVLGESIVDGTYNVWGQTAEQSGSETFIIGSTPEMTLTTPSTAQNIITVGAYNSITNQIAPFSGRGYTRGPVQVKPDLVAPGVDILAPSNAGGYRTLSGTSMATPHVTGGIALMMQWGIVQGNNPFLYGENLRSYLLRGAVRDTVGITYPDPSWGYGKLCIKNSLDVLRRERVFS